MACALYVRSPYKIVLNTPHRLIFAPSEKVDMIWSSLASKLLRHFSSMSAYDIHKLLWLRGPSHRRLRMLPKWLLAPKMIHRDINMWCVFIFLMCMTKIRLRRYVTWHTPAFFSCWPYVHIYTDHEDIVGRPRNESEWCQVKSLYHYWWATLRSLLMLYCPLILETGLDSKHASGIQSTVRTINISLFDK